jgi:hypothetical protein
MDFYSNFCILTQDHFLWPGTEYVFVSYDKDPIRSRALPVPVPNDCFVALWVVAVLRFPIRSDQHLLCWIRILSNEFTCK